MSKGNDTSSLEHDIEATREHLAGTIDQLIHRAHPKTILGRQVSSVKAFFVDVEGQPRTDNILKVVGGVVGTVAVIVAIRTVVS